MGWSKTWGTVQPFTIKAIEPPLPSPPRPTSIRSTQTIFCLAIFHCTIVAAALTTAFFCTNRYPNDQTLTGALT